MWDYCFEEASYAHICWRTCHGVFCHETTGCSGSATSELSSWLTPVFSHHMLQWKYVFSLLCGSIAQTSAASLLGGSVWLKPCYYSSLCWVSTYIPDGVHRVKGSVVDGFVLGCLLYTSVTSQEVTETHHATTLFAAWYSYFPWLIYRISLVEQKILWLGGFMEVFKALFTRCRVCWHAGSMWAQRNWWRTGEALKKDSPVFLAWLILSK